jgi:DNA-binding transcriptional ArsR family regulator/very-short-patch-repair endonuclease
MNDGEKLKQIFKYLKETKNYKKNVKRNIRDSSEFLIWNDEIPLGSGCELKFLDFSDFWMKIEQQKLTPPPKMPQELEKWVDGDINNFKSQITFKKKLELIDDGTGKELFEILFEEDLDRVFLWENYLTKWNKWVKESEQKSLVRDLYSRLFSIYQSLEINNDSMELVWGHGFLKWTRNGENIHMPMIITPLKLEFDTENAFFRIYPAKTPHFDLGMVKYLDIPYIEQIENIQKNFNNEIQNSEENILDPRNFEEIKPLLLQIVHYLDPDGELIEKNVKTATSGNKPFIMDTPALFLRKKPDDIWDNEFEDVIEYIDGKNEIPKSLLAIVSSEYCDSTSIVNSFENLKNDSINNLDDDILFPLPSNPEQKEIIYRLEKNPGVAVQGPPGTGKSHTIANLISHLVSKGKRVLVTSQKEKPLKVLAEKIPKEIKDLCITVTGTDSESLKDLENSIMAISEKLSEDPRQYAVNICNYKTEYYEIRKEIATLKSKLKRSRLSDYSKIKYKGSEISPCEASKIITKNKEKYDWLNDNIRYGTNIELSDGEISEYFNLMNKLSNEDLHDLEYILPDSNKLINYWDLEEIFNKVSDLEKYLVENKPSVSHFGEIKIDNSEITEYSKYINDYLAEILKLEEHPWMINIFDESIELNVKKNYWNNIYQELYGIHKELGEILPELATSNIKIPAEIESEKLKKHYEKIESRLKDKKDFKGIYKLTNATICNVYQNTYLNGKNITSEEELSKIWQYIRLNDLEEHFKTVWNNSLVLGGASQITSFNTDLKYVNNILYSLEFIVKNNEKYSNLDVILDKLSINIDKNFESNKKTWQDIQKLFEVIKIENRLKDQRKNYENLINYLKYETPFGKSHDSWQKLLNSLENKDLEAYKNTSQNILRLTELLGYYSELKQLEEKISKYAPNWILSIKHEKSETGKVQYISNWKDAFEYRMLCNKIEEILTEYDIEAIEKEIAFLSSKERILISKMVSDFAWLNLIKNTKDIQRRSLIQWVQQVRRVGKGTGKYAKYHIQNAQKQMNIAKDAIPVWIMPLNKVVENIRLTDDLFDVVIVDESSQCTIYSLSALMRAKKAVVVGDDNQISPEAVGIDQEIVRENIRKYLYGIPQAESFDLKTSLFDLAVKIFPGQLMLKEHFRCVPEIIQFSNDLMYGGQMVPLRIPSQSERLKNPVTAIKVDEGFISGGSKKINVPEAEKIVSDILEMVNDKRYDNMTFGVISLTGYDQANLINNMLIEKLGPEEMRKRKLICGNSYDFQGDERNIMFLSMVIADNAKYAALTKREYMQMFNVAASRAKDQSRLYHSVELGELSSQCMRARLLNYYLDPNRVINEVKAVEDQFDSGFEKDVFKLLTSKGYRVTPQVRVGKYKIDLVIEGMTSRLAVECDGDKYHGLDAFEKDLERQQTLERVGWTFSRIRASSYYLDPEKAILPVITKLNELKIYPHTEINREKVELGHDEYFKDKRDLTNEILDKNTLEFETDVIDTSISSENESKFLDERGIEEKFTSNYEKNRSDRTTNLTSNDDESHLYAKEHLLDVKSTNFEIPEDDLKEKYIELQEEIDPEKRINGYKGILEKTNNKELINLTSKLLNFEETSTKKISFEDVVEDEIKKYSKKTEPIKSSEYSLKDYSNTFSAISDETRLTILELLLDSDGKNVQELIEILQKPQPTISHHLIILKSANLISDISKGTYRIYSVVNSKKLLIESVMQLLGHNVDKIDILKAISDETRLTILELLLDSDGKNVQELIEILQKPQPTISHHINILKSANLLKLTKKGRFNQYSVDNNNLKELLRMIVNQNFDGIELNDTYSKNDVPVALENEDPNFYYCIVDNCIIASGKIIPENHFLVNKGSKALITGENGVGTYPKLIRSQLLGSGALIEKGGYLVFNTDYEFGSYKTALEVVLGNSSENIFWANSKREKLY